MKRLLLLFAALSLVACTKQKTITQDISTGFGQPSRVLELMSGDSFLLRFDREDYNRFMLAQQSSCSNQVHYMDSLYPNAVVNLDTIYQTDYFLCNQGFTFILSELTAGKAEVIDLKSGTHIHEILKTEVYRRKNTLDRRKLKWVEYRTAEGRMIYFHDFSFIVDF